MLTKRTWTKRTLRTVLPSIQINGKAPAYSISVPPTDVEAYLGIISAAEIFSIRIDGGATDSHWSIDVVSYGSTIPEPSSVGLIGIAAIGLLLGRKPKEKLNPYENPGLRQRIQRFLPYIPDSSARRHCHTLNSRNPH